MNYDVEIENSKANGILSYADIFDYRDTPNEDLFGGLYIFCRENLNINAVRENINPNIFLFTTSFSVNAKAGFKNKQFAILINMGLMQSCITNYFENKGLDQYVENNFPDYIKKFDNPISILAFQLTTQFTYYHELAHLFQLTKRKVESELQERKSKDDKFNIIKHKLEINADTYSSIAIATHLQQYIDKTFGDEVNIDIAKDTIKILGACLLNYILNFSEETTIYFRENSHPHPFLRLLNIVLNIANHIESMPNLKKNNIHLNGKDIFKDIIDFYQNLEENGVFSTKFSDLVYQNTDFKNDIVIYLSELLDFDKADYHDAMDIWNKHII